MASAVSADSDISQNNNATLEEKTIQHIQVQQKQIHKKLVHIEAQLTTRD